jgi:hypothetical protein
MGQFGLFLLALFMTTALLMIIEPGASSPRQAAPEATRPVPAGAQP